MNSHDTSLSKRLSLVLRHRPDSIGLVLDDLVAALAADPGRGSRAAVT
ncbi:hypothetical protein ABFU82_03460 [Nocardioides sp. WV_118_6]